MFKTNIQIFILLSLILIEIGNSQNLNFIIKTNKAHYSMSEDLNVIQKEIRSNFYTLDFKITDDFPSTYNYQIILNINNYWDFDKDLSSGIFFDVASTAGRIHYKDYSGEFESTQKISRWAFGFHLEKEFATSKRISIIPSLQFSYIKTRLKSNYILDLSNLAEMINNTTYENSFAIEPGLNLQYKIFNVVFRISTGYQLDLEGSRFLTFESIDKNYSFKPNWSGIRYGFSLGYFLF